MLLYLSKILTHHMKFNVNFSKKYVVTHRSVLINMQILQFVQNIFIKVFCTMISFGKKVILYLCCASK